VLRRSLRLAAALCLCAALGPELYLRMTLHPPANPATYDFPRPPLARVQVSIAQPMPGLTPRTTLYTTSALGVRADELDLRDHTALRLLTLGDSVTECLLLADAEAWPHRVQERLASRLQRRVWVGNAAGSGELSLDYIVHVRKLVPQLAPDLVLIMPGGYELQASLEEKLLPMDLSDPQQLETYAARLYGAQNDQAKKNLGALQPSYLSYVLRARVAPEVLDMTGFYLRMRERRAAHPKRAQLPDFDDALDVYKANLRAIVAAWRALPEHPVLAFITRPFMWKAEMSDEEERTLWGGYTCMDCPDPEYYATAALALGLRRFNQTLLDICAEQSLPCFDLEASLPKDLTSFYDDAHLRAQGAERSAHEIVNFLITRRLVH
jgi:lysophospholipase L1-like esterase